MPTPQAVPQAPQLVGSDVRSTQPVAQGGAPLGQAQALLTQLEPAGQTMPQFPQLALSLAGTTHKPLQLNWPGAHVPTLPAVPPTPPLPLVVMIPPAPANAPPAPPAPSVPALL